MLSRFLGALFIPLFFAGLCARADNIYVSFDSNNPTVEEYASAQINGNPSYTGSTFATNQLDDANGVAFDHYGDLYVANSNGNTITEYNPSGMLTATYSSSLLNQPGGLAFDSNGDLFVANTGNGQALEFTASQLASSGGAATPSVYAIGLGSPNGLAFDGMGNLYVADYGESIIYQIPATGGAPVVFISPGDYTTINHPTGIAFDSLGNLYVSNSVLNDIEEFPLGGGTPQLFANSGDNLDNPDGIAFDSSGDLYVVNYAHPNSVEGAPYGYSSVEELSSTGSLLNTFNVDSSTNFNLKDGGYVAIETNSGTPTLDPAPEPANAALFALGASFLLGFSRIRRRRA
jgi:sugar lactone lactonase YvrE